MNNKAVGGVCVVPGLAKCSYELNVGMYLMKPQKLDPIWHNQRLVKRAA
jgi:hypothetical protein